MQLSHREPAIRHAVMALSSLYEHFQHEPKLPLLMPTNLFALRHYNAAIEKLLVNPDEAVVLVVCTIFLCIEFLQGNAQSAINHCRSGILILNKACPSSAWARICLLPMFSRLSIFPLFFGGTVSSFPCVAGLETNTPPRFSSIVDAKSSLDVLLAISIRFVRSCEDYRLGKFRCRAVPEVLRKQQGSLERSLDAWYDAFSQSRRYAHTRFEGDSFACCLLQVKLLVSQIWVNTAVERAEIAYDRHVDKFQFIVDLASQVALPESQALGQPGFIFDIGFTPLLYFVAMKCRRLSTRVEALSLMRSLGSGQETLWNLETLFHVGRRLIEIEHEIQWENISAIIQQRISVDSQVLPEESRVRDVSLDPNIVIRQDDQGGKKLWALMHSIMWRPINDLVVQRKWIAIS